MKRFTRISLWLGMMAIAAALALPARANTWPLPPPGVGDTANSKLRFDDSYLKLAAAGQL